MVPSAGPAVHDRQQLSLKRPELSREGPGSSLATHQIRAVRFHAPQPSTVEEENLDRTHRVARASETPESSEPAAQENGQAQTSLAMCSGSSRKTLRTTSSCEPFLSTPNNAQHSK